MSAISRAISALRVIFLVAAVSFGASSDHALAADWIPAPGQILGVGYLGNSLSYTCGAMPGQLVSLAGANGDLITTKGNTQPGWQLSDHASNAASLAVVSDTTMNVVMVQQYSTGVVDAASLATLSNPVLNHGGQVILYETWGYSTTWQTDIPRLRQNYLQMTVDVKGGATICPVGLAWWQVLNGRPDIALFVDDRHPTLAGAYLAGCVESATIFGRSPVENSYTGTWGTGSSMQALDPATAGYLQGVAAQVVLDNPWAKDQWGYGSNNFLWAYDWTTYTNRSGSTLPGTVISGGGGQPSPSVKVDANAGAVDSVYLGVTDSAGIAGQGRLYIFDGGTLGANRMVVGKDGQGWVKQTGGTLTVTGTLSLGTGMTSYGTYALSGSGTLDTGNGVIEIQSGTFNLNGGTVRFHALNIGTNGTLVDTGSSSLILSDSQSGISVASGTAAINSPLSGTGGFTKTGAGTLMVCNTNTYSGDTNINSGALIVSGVIQGATTRVNSNATLLGSGTIGALNVGTEGIVNPGNIVGTLTAGDTIFQPGGIFSVRLIDATGTAGADWNSLVIRGNLNLVNLNGSDPFRFKLQTMNSSTATGLMGGFSADKSYTWTLASFSSLTGSFSSGEFLVDTTLFANAFSGTFSIGLDNSSDSLNLVYLPIPELEVRMALVYGFGLVALVNFRNLKQIPIAHRRGAICGRWSLPAGESLIGGTKITNDHRTHHFQSRRT